MPFGPPDRVQLPPGAPDPSGPYDCPRSSPVPVLRRSEGSQGHTRAAHNTPYMRCKARKSLVAHFHVLVGTYCTAATKARHTPFTRLSAAFRHAVRKLPPRFAARSARTQPQNATEPPEPRRIFAQDSSGFSLCFCSGFHRLFTVISVRPYSQP